MHDLVTTQLIYKSNERITETMNLICHETQVKYGDKLRFGVPRK